MPANQRLLRQAAAQIQCFRISSSTAALAQAMTPARSALLACSWQTLERPQAHWFPPSPDIQKHSTAATRSTC